MPNNSTKYLRQQFINVLLRDGDSKHGYSYKQILNLVQKQKELNGVKLDIITIKRDIEYFKENKNCNLISTKIGKEFFYRYNDSTESAFELPVTEDDIIILNQAYIQLLQKKGSLLGIKLLPIILKLQKRFSITASSSSESIILDHTPQSEGLQWIEKIINSISEKGVIKLTYQPFGKEKQIKIVCPCFIKEANNRWFLFGKEIGEVNNKIFAPKNYNSTTTYALDRILEIGNSTHGAWVDCDFEKLKKQLESVIGVTLNEGSIEKIRFKLSDHRVNYVNSKPIHLSQRNITNKENKNIFEISVIPNNELFAKLLEFTGDITIISPAHIKNTFNDKLKASIKMNK